jgi:hypothetical protein
MAGSAGFLTGHPPDLGKSPIRYWGAEIQAIDEDISARAMYFVESYALSHGMQMADALIASTALSIGAPLLTANDKHYRHVDDLEIDLFRP